MKVANLKKLSAEDKVGIGPPGSSPTLLLYDLRNTQPRTLNSFLALQSVSKFQIIILIERRGVMGFLRVISYG
jgi:hypothetical protein